MAAPSGFGFGNTGPQSSSQAVFAFGSRVSQAAPPSASDDIDDITALTHSMNQVSIINSTPPSVALRHVIQKLLAQKQSTLQFKSILIQVLDMSIVKVDEIVGELEAIELPSEEQMAAGSRRRKTNIGPVAAYDEPEEMLMIDYNFTEVFTPENNLSFVEEVNKKVSDQNVKNFSQQIHPTWLRNWFVRENSRKHRAFFLKLMLFLAKNDYQNYIPTTMSTIIYKDEDIIPLIVTYVTANGIIFHHLCRSALKEMESKGITLSSLDLERALVEIKNRVDTGQITTPGSTSSRQLRSASKGGQRLRYDESRDRDREDDQGALSLGDIADLNNFQYEGSDLFCHVLDKHENEEELCSSISFDSSHLAANLSALADETAGVSSWQADVVSEVALSSTRFDKVNEEIAGAEEAFYPPTTFETGCKASPYFHVEEDEDHLEEESEADAAAADDDSDDDKEKQVEQIQSVGTNFRRAEDLEISEILETVMAIEELTSEMEGIECMLQHPHSQQLLLTLCRAVRVMADDEMMRHRTKASEEEESKQGEASRQNNQISQGKNGAEEGEGDGWTRNMRRNCCQFALDALCNTSMTRQGRAWMIANLQDPRQLLLDL
ncbi:hypothetical protein GUITHDRAFT_114594 [Guillardia theta CCMP2712]|uniref:Uncharacterized protein n=1 Tax=Guillardia theta (strain CCMP2712) TaxID=905079 RepID=L1IT13_GUITC|nr:hypothetical protein GUITHDRAFT_114594 [Guillardia theta CCMP2712]EKX39396.1 hypothetical protein GUITHDRAFT_114594 [Guillardia theta CCMP2712]|eukprot:XP_005826376.1 hypothetical protein GUITHDRAFT_114594 [Guillardia theta CCMP2712]